MIKTGKLVLVILLIATATLFSQTIDSSFLPDFHSMFDHHGSVMLIIESKTGSIVYANTAAVEFYGYQEQELLSMKISQINTLSPEQVAQEMQRALSEERNHFVFRHRVADQSIRTVEVYSYPYTLEGNNYLFSIIHDVTEVTLLERRNHVLLIIIGGIGALLIVILLLFLTGQKRHTKRITVERDTSENMREQLQAFLDADTRLSYLKDSNLRYVYVNKAFEEFFEKGESELVGRDDYAISDSEFADLRRSTDIRVVETKMEIKEEVSWNGRVYSTIKFPVQLADGSIGVGAYIEDVTEEKVRLKAERKGELRNSMLVEVFNHHVDSIEEQLDYALQKALELTDSSYGYIYLYDEEKKEFTLNSWSSEVMADCLVVNKETVYELEKTGIWGEAVRQRKPIIVNDFQAQHPLKKGTPEGHVQFSNFLTIPIIIGGKIVATVGVAQKDGDYDDSDVAQLTLLMVGVWNAKERREHEIALQKSQESLRLILDSTAEGIYGIDKDGICTFCNASALSLLGYDTSEELIGKEMHSMIHHSTSSGDELSIDECKIHSSLKDGIGISLEEDVFWKKDGTSFDVLCRSYPQIKEGTIVGAVITFTDNTERKEYLTRIAYLSYHDQLTGLYNRMFFEEELKRLDVPRNYPLSILLGDMNGLKFANDVFGHSEGDRLLISVAQAMKQACRADDIIARVGGDEFALILPKASYEHACSVAQRIQNNLPQYTGNLMPSISIGCATKEESSTHIEHIMDTAELNMYTRKTLGRKQLQHEVLKTMIKQLYELYPEKQEETDQLTACCEQFGKLYGLVRHEIIRLKQLSQLRHIGLVVIDRTDDISQEEEHIAVIGYRILSALDHTTSIADDVLSQYEMWDGKGIPKGLTGSEIPILARMLRLCVEVYHLKQKHVSKEAFLTSLKMLSDTVLDPELVSLALTEYERTYQL